MPESFVGTESELGLKPELEKESLALKTKPSVIQLLLPFLLTFGIFWWIFSGIDLDKVMTTLQGLDWFSMLLVMTVFCIFFMLMDVFSFGAGYKLFVEKETPWRDLFFIRGGAMFTGVLFPPLAEVVAPYYFVKRWKQPILRVIGAGLLVLVLDSYCATAALGIVFIFFDTASISANWLYLVIAHWSLLVVGVVVFSSALKYRLPSRLRDSHFFSAFMNVTLLLALRLYLVRLCAFVAVCVTLYYLMSAMKIELTVAQSLLFIPIFMASVFLPISAGGYGGPQGAAILLLVDAWQVASAEQALAFSILWSTFFLVGRTLVGGAFIIPLWILFRRISTDHASD